MKRKLLAVAVLAAIAHAPASMAANWFQVENTEPANAPAYKFFGMVEGQYTHINAAPVYGLGGVNGTSHYSVLPYNGQYAAFNLVGPDLTSRDQAQISHAIPGVRGALADGKVDYILAADFGQNGINETGFNSITKTYNSRTATLIEAAATFNYIPGARVRVGLGRLPLGEEALQAGPAVTYAQSSAVTDGLLNERFLTPVYINPNYMPSLYGETMNGGVVMTNNLISQAAEQAGSLGAFRDTGVEFFDWFNQGKMEYSYALMVSQGDGVNWNTANNPGNHDITGRLQASYIFGGAGPLRQDVTAYIWHQEGKRYFNGADYDRMREGVGAKYLEGKLRVSGEYIQGTGMIYMGPYVGFGNTALSPTNGSSPAGPGGVPAAYSGPVTPFVISQMMAMESFNKASGYYIETGWKFTDKIEGDLRYDYYDKLSNSLPDERIQKDVTIGAHYHYSKSLGFLADFTRRKLSGYAGTYPLLVNGTASNGAKQSMANSIDAIATMGNMFTLQMNYTF